jgi:hypothetical protein
MRLTRRGFLSVAVPLMTATPLAAAVAVHEPTRDQFKKWLALVLTPERRLRANFWYLDHGNDTIESFVADYREHFGPFPTGQWPEGIYTRYLMSTDFFQNGEDESRPLLYRQIYAPDISICNNPFAEFDDEVTT